MEAAPRETLQQSLLPHQDAALMAASRAVEQQHPGFMADLEEVARRKYDLVQAAFAGPAGLAPLIEAVRRLPADRRAEMAAEAERKAKADAQRAEFEALAPARERLLAEQMYEWWQANYPHSLRSDYGYSDKVANAKLVEARLKAEIERMPAAMLRPIAAKLAQADEQAAQEAAAEAAARPWPSPSPY